MKINGLLNNQKVEIDHHQRGSGSPNNWDDSTQDVHLDKYVTNNKDSYKIRIPINSNRSVTVNRSDGLGVPEWLRKEVCDAFSDEQQCRSFVNEICRAISTYSSTKLTPEQKARQAVGYIRKAFGLPIPRFVFQNDIKHFYAELYFVGMYYYVVYKSGTISCSKNNGVWKRFVIKDDDAFYIYDKNIRSSIIKEESILP